jgi:hypothetical protein
MTVSSMTARTITAVGVLARRIRSMTVSSMTARTIAAIGVLALAASPALAQTPSRDPAAAEALYKAGRDLVAKGDWDTGCPKFDASMTLDPVASTLLNIAKCHEHYGRLARAWADYKRALVLNQDTPGAERRKTLGDIATRGIEALEPRLPKMKILLRERPEGVRVTRDGQEMPLAMLGEVIPVDPGDHEVAASAPGYAREQRKVKLEEGKTIEVELHLAPSTEAPKTPALGATTTPPPPPKDDDKPSSGGIPTWAWVVGGAGIGLIGAGVAFRVDGAAAESTLDENCGEMRVCDPSSGYDPTSDNARKNRDFILFAVLGGAGVAAVSAAVIGIATAPRASASKSSSAVMVRAGGWVSPTSYGASLTGVY